ncbi:hypothetical protein VTI74DRAFT_614 [Chaetomium olivicolor]
MSISAPFLLFLPGLLVALAWASPACLPSPVLQLSLGSCSVLSPGQPDVHSWGVLLGIDRADSLCAAPSTVLSNSFLTTDDLCTGSQLVDIQGLRLTDAQCRSRRGGYITQARPLPEAPTDGLAAANPNWIALGNNITSAAVATLRFLDQSVTMTVGLIRSGQQSTASHLGLDAGSVLLRSLKDKSLIAARSFGLNVGSQSAEFPRRGSLVLGGYDQASFASSSVAEYPISTAKLNNRHCPLQVQVEKLTLSARRSPNSTDTEDREIWGQANPVTFCIEPYDNLFRLPNNTILQVTEFFKARTGYSGTPVPTSDYQDKLANLEPGLVYPRSAASAFNGSMRLTLKDGFTVDIPVHEMQRPLRGLDSNGQVVVDNDYTEIQIYGKEAPGLAPVLGKTFLSQVYLYVDYDAGIFRLAPQALEVTTPVPVSSASCATILSPSDKGLIGVGSVVGALLLCLLAYATYRFRRSKATSKESLGPANEPGNEVVRDENLVTGPGGTIEPPDDTDGSTRSPIPDIERPDAVNDHRRWVH